LSSSAQALPTLTSRLVSELDRLTADGFGIPVEWLMEAAGWRAAFMCDFPTAVVCGPGNNGGDGLAAARHLHRWGRLVSVSCVDRSKLSGPAEAELTALEKSGVEVGEELRLDGAQIVLDAIFGTGLRRPPDGRSAEWIEAINGSGLDVVAVDVPSGLDADSGLAYSPCVRATTTITFTLPKRGLLLLDGPRFSGEVWVGDIGIPMRALREIGVTPPESLFQLSEIFKLAP
jgi:ADP-dependent NAD(P)H-hydrate dehydratase / NAD(P)H-hydrate epimerase